MTAMDGARVSAESIFGPVRDVDGNVRLYLERPCGSPGGQGRVYQCIYRPSTRRAAVKLPLPDRVSGVFGSVDAEAKMLKRVRDSGLPGALHVIGYIDSFKTGPIPGIAPYGSFALVMELADKSLEQEMPFLTAAEKLHRLADIVDGLSALHRSGAVHKDLKPANILVVNGMAKISDLGVTQLLPRDLTHVVGPGIDSFYTAPECFTAGRSQAWPESDIFAVGVIAHELLAGRRPTVGDDGSTRHVDDGIPGTHREWIRACLSANRKLRPDLASIARRLPAPTRAPAKTVLVPPPAPVIVSPVSPARAKAGPIYVPAYLAAVAMLVGALLIGIAFVARPSIPLSVHQWINPPEAATTGELSPGAAASGGSATAKGAGTATSSTNSRTGAGTGVDHGADMRFIVPNYAVTAAPRNQVVYVVKMVLTNAGKQPIQARPENFRLLFNLASWGASGSWSPASIPPNPGLEKVVVNGVTYVAVPPAPNHKTEAINRYSRTFATIWKDKLTNLGPGSTYKEAGDRAVIAFYGPTLRRDPGHLFSPDGVAYVTLGKNDTISAVHAVKMRDKWGPETCPENFGRSAAASCF